jgi:hypothetical protein
LDLKSPPPGGGAEGAGGETAKLHCFLLTLWEDIGELQRGERVRQTETERQVKRETERETDRRQRLTGSEEVKSYSTI